MEIKKDLLKREIAGDSFLIPVGKSVYDTNGMFVLTELGAFIWDLLPQVNDAEDILEKVLAEYEVDEATARTDVETFLQKLRDMGIL
jgi:hypothetical protein